MKDELKIPKDLKEDLRDTMEHNAPTDLLKGVMKKIQEKKKMNVSLPDMQLPFIAALAALGGLVGLTIYSSKENLTTAPIEYHFEIPLVFWWSLLAVCFVLAIDFTIKKRKGKSF